MHEKSLISNLVKKIQLIAGEEKASKVLSITIKLGALSHISPEHFREHFERDVVGTIAEGAELIVQTSEAIDDPNAQDILLLSVDIEE